MNFLKLIRYPNLLLIALMQLVFRYGFLKPHNILLALNDWQYGLLILSTCLIAAGGYVINDIYDQRTDHINKPNKQIIGVAISEATAHNIYLILNTIGVIIGFYLSNVILKPGFAAIFIFIAATLYIYSTTLKKIALLGNIAVAVLLSLSVIIIGVFDMFPATYSGNQAVMANLFSILLDYGIFAFMINFLREIVKDLEDMDGDYQDGMKTLPIVFGTARTSKSLSFLGIIPIVVLLSYINKYFIPNDLLIATIYSLLTILGPLIYFSIKIFGAKSRRDFHRLSTVLKWILIFGILSVLVVTFNIKHNA